MNERGKVRHASYLMLRASPICLAVNVAAWRRHAGPRRFIVENRIEVGPDGVLFSRYFHQSVRATPVGSLKVTDVAPFRRPAVWRYIAKPDQRAPWIEGETLSYRYSVM